MRTCSTRESGQRPRPQLHGTADPSSTRDFPAGDRASGPCTGPSRALVVAYRRFGTWYTSRSMDTCRDVDHAIRRISTARPCRPEPAQLSSRTRLRLPSARYRVHSAPGLLAWRSKKSKVAGSGPFVRCGSCPGTAGIPSLSLYSTQGGWWQSGWDLDWDEEAVRRREDW